MSDLNLYGAAQRCVKCGGEQIFSKFRSLDNHAGAPFELIQRMCGNCNYTWNEAPLDSGPIVRNEQLEGNDAD